MKLKFVGVVVLGVVSVILLALLLRGQLLPYEVATSLLNEQGFPFFLSPGAIKDPAHDKRKLSYVPAKHLSYVPAKHLSLPASFNIVDLAPSSVDDGNDDFNCTLTSTTPKFHICVYPKEEDVYISADLTTQGVWHPHITTLLQLALTRFADAVLIDLGANIGYFTLLAAAMGHRVVAVEPSLDNVRRLRRGVQLNGVFDKVHVLHNAVSNTHRNVTLSQHRYNQGELHVMEERGQDHHHTIQTIVLDDLLHLIHTRTAIIKIDIEGHECQGMATSAKLLHNVYVPYILMEWSYMYKYRHHPTTACPVKSMRQLTDYLVSQGYRAYDTRSGAKLDAKRSTFWQNGDVFWRHEKQPLLVPPL